MLYQREGSRERGFSSINFFDYLSDILNRTSARTNFGLSELTGGGRCFEQIGGFSWPYSCGECEKLE